MLTKTNSWLKLSLVNFLIVAALGTLMRYKIGFDLPFFEQKNVQHSHSHFAFAGWITHTLYVLMLSWMAKSVPPDVLKKYRLIVIANLVCSYGMLLFLFIQGYGALSITFSQLSIFNNYIFAFCFIRDLRLLRHHPSAKWFRAALWFNAIASLGTYTLAFMMMNKQILQKVYLGSVYFFLHFQYNGWFFFACMGLLIGKLHESVPDFKEKKSLFLLFMLSCIPAYLLSALWLDLPVWLYIIVVAAAILQFAAWLGMSRFLVSHFTHLKGKIPAYSKIIFLLLLVCVTIKFTLQLISVIPSISDLTFGFRPIVIAYLHLVLLAIISMFLVNYLMTFGFIRPNRGARYGLALFVSGVFLNELALGIQGIAAFSYTLIPRINEILFAVALLIFISLFILLVSQMKRAAA